ncbi:MAG: hypothetical protein IJX25_01595 [Clostridia bacterium]|nr:hypothetical protein [Clostridia bacterium]MBQ8793055.1 hypothetical protein [Clostridia bacterium]
MKRPMTLTGGILATVANAIVSVLMAIGLVAIFEVLAGAEVTGTFTVLIVALLELAVFVVALVMSIIAITAWAKDAAGFKKKKAILIVAAVFNFIGAIIAFIAGSIFYILLALVMIAAAVLFIVDVALEGKRVKATETQPTQE